MDFVKTLKSELKKLTTDELKRIELVGKLARTCCPVEQISEEQRSIRIDLIRWEIQLELDNRNAGELPYTFGEMYLSVGLSKYFLN